MKCLENFSKPQKPWEVEGVEWREVMLGEVCQRRGENVIPVENNQIYVGLEHINSGEIKLVRWGYSNKVKSTKYKFYPDDILYGKLRPYLDKAVISDKEGICSTDFIVITPMKDKVLPYYLIYFLHTKLFMNYSTSMMKGVHLPRVSWNIIKKVKLPLPFRNGKSDVETQKKIVEHIETSFSKIDSILEKKKKILAQLYELWGSTLENAFKPKEGEEWREVKLGEIIVDKPRYGLTAKSKNKGKYLYLRITDINDKGEINQDGFKFVDLDEKEKSKYEIKKGDLLLARSGSVGNFFIADKDYPDWVYASYLIRFRLDSNKILPSFIKHILISRKFKRWVEYQKRTGAQPNINAKEYSSFKLTLPFRNDKPDLERQKKIADYLDKVYEKIKSIKEKVQFQINQLDEMKESILNEVFRYDKGN